MVADRPDKPETERPVLLEGLRALLGDGGRREILIESAYFIPSADESRRLCGLVADGSHVRVLTNSLASTDVLIAYVDTPSGAPASYAAGSRCTSCAPTRASCAAGAG